MICPATHRPRRPVSRPGTLFTCLALASALAACAPLATAAQAPATVQARAEHDAQLHVAATAYREVVQDRVTVILYAERESAQAAAGQTQVSAVLGPVLDQLKARTDLEVQSSGYRTDPVWQQSRVVGWRTRGAIQVSAAPSEVFNRLIGELASRLNIESVSYWLSRAARLAVEQELIAEAVGAFRDKAAIGARALGFHTYAVREVSIDGSTPMPPQPIPRTMMARAAESSPVPLPGAEGKTTVTVTVSGSVTLEP